MTSMSFTSSTPSSRRSNWTLQTCNSDYNCDEFKGNSGAGLAKTDKKLFCCRHKLFLIACRLIQVSPKSFISNTFVTSAGILPVGVGRDGENVTIMDLPGDGMARDHLLTHLQLLWVLIWQICRRTNLQVLRSHLLSPGLQLYSFLPVTILRLPTNPSQTIRSFLTSACHLRE